MNAFLQELEQVSAELRQQAGQFTAQQRQDDADLTKIRANIYEICATIGKVMCKTQPEEAREAAFLKKLEELKLEALADVLARFHTRKEG